MTAMRSLEHLSVDEPPAKNTEAVHDPEMGNKVAELLRAFREGKLVIGISSPVIETRHTFNAWCVEFGSGLVSFHFKTAYPYRWFIILVLFFSFLDEVINRLYKKVRNDIHRHADTNREHHDSGDRRHVVPDEKVADLPAQK